MNRVSFFLLLTIALATSCSKTETQSNTQAHTLPIPQVETKTTLQATVSTTETQVSEKPVNETIVTLNAKPNAAPATFEQLYQQILENPIAAANDIAIATGEVAMSNYFYEETPIGKYFAQNIKQSEILTMTPSLLDAVSITGKEGTVVTFPPASLVDEDGNPVTSPVQIELKECYNTLDILNANLTTTCNDMILETGGMVYVHATCNGKPLHLLPTHPIMIEMPTQNKKENMELFYGEKRPASGVMNWRVADTRRRNNAPQISASREMKKDWDKVGESTDVYEVGDLELSLNLKETGIDGKPMVSFQVKNINPKLEKYKEQITATLNKVAWENDDEAKASGKTLYEYKQHCLLGGVMFANLGDLLKIRDDIGKYKNFNFKRTIPLQAHLDKELYYRKVGLLSTYSFDKAAWEQDRKFFAANFEKAKGSKNTFFDKVIEALQASKDQLMNAYTARYATSYLFTANQMGWINCDRFDPNMGERTDLMVKYDNKDEMDIKLIFTEDRSLLPGRDMGKNLAFMGLPKGKKAVVMGTKVMNDMPYFSFKEITVGEDRKVELTGFKRMTMAELEKELIRLGIAS